MEKRVVIGRSVVKKIDLGSCFLSLIFLFLFFFPSKFIYLEQIGLLALLFISYFFVRPNFNQGFVFFVLFLLAMVSPVFGTLYHGSDLVRNFSELFRYLLFFLVLSSFSNLDDNVFIKVFFNVAFLFSLANFILSLSQFFSLPAVSFLTNFYGADNHIQVSLQMSSRALGLSSGPGQNGVISVVLYSIFYAFYIIGYRDKKNLAVILLSASSVFLSQSQTSFIVLMGISLYGVGFAVLNFKYAKPFLLLVALLPIGILMAETLITDFQYLATLFSQGLERHSYVAREIKTARLFDLAVQNSFGLIFGNGKDYFGESAMDNEYIFLVGVYGLIFSFVVLFGYLYFSLKSWFVSMRFHKRNPYLAPLSFLFVSGMVISWPSAFIVDTRVMVLVAFFVSRYFNVEKKGRGCER